MFPRAAGASSCGQCQKANPLKSSRPGFPWNCTWITLLLTIAASALVIRQGGGQRGHKEPNAGVSSTHFWPGVKRNARPASSMLDWSLSVGRPPHSGVTLDMIFRNHKIHSSLFGQHWGTLCPISVLSYSSYFAYVLTKIAVIQTIFLIPFSYKGTVSQENFITETNKQKTRNNFDFVPKKYICHTKLYLRASKIQF